MVFTFKLWMHKQMSKAVMNAYSFIFIDIPRLERPSKRQNTFSFHIDYRD